MKSKRLENTSRRGFLLTRYGISSRGNANNPKRAAGLINSMSLLEESDRRQRGEYEIAEVSIGHIERVMDTALVTETADFQIMVRQLILIVAPRVRIPVVLNLVPAFAVDQSHIAVWKRRIDFGARQNLNGD